MNSRLDELQASLLRVKLNKLSDWNADRLRVAASYNRLLSTVPIKLPKIAQYCSSVWHLYVIQTEKRDELAEFLGFEVYKLLCIIPFLLIGKSVIQTSVIPNYLSQIGFQMNFSVFLFSLI